MKLFALFNGCYSDTRLVGIYSTQAKADAMARVFADDASIYEYELDEHADDALQGKVSWFVRLKRDSGDVMECRLNEYASGSISNECGEDIHKDIYTHCWAMDKEEAIKISSERRRTYLALEPVHDGR